jgi:hypothetical protein
MESAAHPIALGEDGPDDLAFLKRRTRLQSSSSGFLTDSRILRAILLTRSFSNARGTRAGHNTLAGLRPATNLPFDLRSYLWGGEDLNLRPTDYESEDVRAADVQEFLNILARDIT